MPVRFRRGGFRLPVYKAAEKIRQALGWTKTQMQSETGISSYGEYENGYLELAPGHLDRIRVATSLDAYVLAYLLYADRKKIPEPLIEPTERYKEAWESYLKELHFGRRKLPSNWT